MVTMLRRISRYSCWIGLVLLGANRMSITQGTTPDMAPAIKPADIDKLRDHLLQGDRWLAAALAGERDVGKMSRLEFAQAVVRDALGWATESADCATILIALEGVWIGDLSPLAERHVEAARDLCRPVAKQ